MSTSGKGDSSAGAMSGAATDAIAPEDSFLVQFRGNSRLADQAVSGRVEHIVSGASEPFRSLADLLDFVGKYLGRSGSSTEDPPG